MHLYVFEPKFALLYSKINCTKLFLNTGKALQFYTSSNMIISGSSIVDLLVIAFFFYKWETLSVKIASSRPSTSWEGKNGSQFLAVYCVLRRHLHDTIFNTKTNIWSPFWPSSFYRFGLLLKTHTQNGDFWFRDLSGDLENGYLKNG